MPLPVPVRPSSGYTLANPQTMERDTAGRLISYVKSIHAIKSHTLDLVLTFDGFIALQAFFFSFVHGQRNKFTWYDNSGTMRTVRLATNKIAVPQISFNRYTCSLPLIEEA